MDVLSQILSDIHLSLPLLTDLRLGEGTRLNMGSAADQPALGAPFYYAVSGSPTVTIDGGQSIILSPGHLILLPHWDQHFICAGRVSDEAHILDIVSQRHLPLWSRDEDFPGVLQIAIGQPPPVRLLCGIFSFDPNTSRRLFGERNRMIQLNACDADMSASIHLSLELAGHPPSSAAPGFSAVLCKCLELMFVQTVRHWLLHDGQSLNWVRALNDARLRRVIEAIHANPARKWNLNGLARVAGQSRSRFAEHFRRSLEQTPFEYITRWRNHLALGLLAEPTLSISSIADQLGYANASGFAKRFSQEFGVSPSRYRREIGEPRRP